MLTGRTAREALVVVLVVLALLGLWLHQVGQWFERVKPGGPTLVAVLAKMPDPDARRVLDHDGQQYLVLFGQVQSFPRFPSGPPVYVFDGAGKLVDWTSDEGDAPSFHEHWPGVFQGRPVTHDDVLAWPGAK